MQYNALGQLRVVDDDGDDVTPRGQRAIDVLALLILRCGRAVDAQVILDLVWKDDAPSLTPAVVHTVVARLRRILGGDQIQTTGTGYRLSADAEIDATQFGDLVDLARQGPADEAAPQLRTALGLWRGQRAYDGVSDDLVGAERERLEGLRSTVVESLAAALLALPDADGWSEANELVEGLIAADPLRERAYELLMLGSYRLGRQAAALETYTRLRSLLLDELGIAPGPGATELQRQILEQDPALGGGDIAGGSLVVSPGDLALGDEMARPKAEPGDVGRDLVGRREEIAVLTDFVEDGTGACVLLGDPGIGKSALWEAVAEYAVARGLRLLSSRPNEWETRLSFSVLADLLREVDLAAMSELPAPQRAALEVALLRSDGVGEVDSRAISLGLRTVLEVMARTNAVVIAIDDVQWMDAESTEALMFAARRLDRSPIRFMLARRTSHDATQLERIFPPAVRTSVDLSPLDLEETGELLREQGLSVPRRVERLVHDQAAGNVLFTLELAEVLRERGVPAIGESLDVPAEMLGLLGKRVDELSGDLRTLLLAVALDGHLTDEVLISLASAEALDAALAGRLVVVDGISGRARAWHPLLAATVRDRSTPAQRRALHRRLALLVPAGDSRARHLALGTLGTDRALSRELAQASANAYDRRAFETAVELSELALDRTPPDDSERTERILEHAQRLLDAGQAQRLTSFLEPQIDSIPETSRGRAWLMLTAGMVDTVEHLETLLVNALHHSGDDPVVRAAALSQHAMIAAGMKVADIPSALRSGEEAVSLDPTASGGVAWTSALLGRSFEDSVAVGRAGADDPRIAAAMRSSWRGDVRKAREVLGQEMAAADREGRSLDYANHQMHLGEVFVRSGDLETATAVLGLWASSVEAEALESPDDERLRALMAALRGDVAEVERLAPVAILEADRVGDKWSSLEARRALALSAAADGDLETVVEHCQYVWDWAEREGVREVGAFPVAGELVEALAGLGRIDEARVVASRLRELSTEQSHPWGLVTAQRCDAVIALAVGSEQPDVELSRLRAAADGYAELGLVSDEARTLMVLGSELVRNDRAEAAHDVLSRAAARFETMGAVAWVEHAQLVLRNGRKARQPSR